MKMIVRNKRFVVMLRMTHKTLKGVNCKWFTADFRLFSGVQGLAEIKRLSVYGASQRFSAVSSLSSISYND